ncbi:hypothetical protein ABW19_dt0203224 [Dactylella cylindrospora]|nr:hypothetical protein ABW19_dt0203224 [Dactylella cylindrospora]
MAVAKSTSQSIAIIIGSARPGRNATRVTKFIIDSIRENIPKDIRVKVIDIAEWNFPAFELPEIPFLVKSPEDYSTELARRWSREISSHQGFIFLVPEYNGSFAGALKNAFDYLYNEWSNKPAMIVSYGARPAHMLNGGKHFTDILNQLQMKLPTVLPRLSVATMDREKTAASADLVFYEKEVEEQHRREVLEGWESILKNLKASNVSPASA